jgi:type I phosphodiesterase/nucleotide pyrophosphatase
VIVSPLMGGLIGLAVTWLGSLTMGILAGFAAWAVGMLVAWWSNRAGLATDPGRRRFLAAAGIGGLAWAAGGAAIGRVLATAGRPDARAAQRQMASRLGAEYMELVRRAYHPGRSGDLQLIVAPFNSANYEAESLSLVPRDPRTSHAAVWMYLMRIPLVVYGPGVVLPGDSEERVTLADLAPTTAALMGFDGWPDDRDGIVLPGLRTSGVRPKVIVTFVIDGGGWNALHQWPGRWPTLERLLREGSSYRNAIHGSFPAVTATAHATIGTGAFPWKHGITGHNIRDGAEVRKAFGAIGSADASDIKLSTLADLWSVATGNRAWVGELGYQIWHLGMLGHGGPDRPAGSKPVAVYWSEPDRIWAPQHPERYRMPDEIPGIEIYESHLASFESPDWDPQFRPIGRQEPCCAPPIVAYQGDLIEATIRSEPLGRTGSTDLLYVNYKSPDYTGHVYGVGSEWEGLMLEAVDEQLGRLISQLDGLFPGEYVLFVTADHGQCPLPDDAGGVRLDPIQLRSAIEGAFGGLLDPVQEVVPSEVYLYPDKLTDAGADVEDVAAFLADLTYRRNLGPYVPASAIEQDLLDRKEFAAVFATPFLDDLLDADLSELGATVYSGPNVDPGIPAAT